MKPGAHAVSLRSIAGAFTAAGLAIASVSAAFPVTYDEGDWLAVARRLASGDVLYRDVVDNKSPPIYWAMRALDWVPGPFTLARGIFIATLAVWLGLGVRAIAQRLGIPPTPAFRLGIGLTFAAAFQSVFVLNIEIAATSFIIGGMLAVVRGRALLGGTIAAGAVVVDPRAIVFAVGLALLAAEHGGRPRAFRVLAGGMWLIGWFAYLALSPNARYAVLELNAATRGTLSNWRLAEVIGVTMVANLPAVAAFISCVGRPGQKWVRAMSRSKAGLAMLAGAVLVSIASAFPFYKYWIMVLPSLPLLAAACFRVGAAQPERMPKNARPAFLLALALLPMAAHAVDFRVEQSNRVSRYERAAEELSRMLGSGQTFVPFDTQPFMTMLLPQHSGLPWAVQDFLAVKSSRRTQNFIIVSTALDRATAIVDDGALSLDQRAVQPDFRQLWRIFHGELSRFPCVVRTNGLTIRRRAAACVRT